MADERNIGFVTYSALGELTDDDQLLATELRRRGYTLTPIPWDLDRPPALPVVVIRSPWNYHLRAEAFLNWVSECARTSTVHNDTHLLRWNVHKSYLQELAAAGVPTVPTIVAKKHNRYHLAAILEEQAWELAVVKPAVSASSYMTAKVSLSDHIVDGWLHAGSDGQEFFEAILQSGDALVQPFISSVYAKGERCLTYIDGVFSHAVIKQPFNTTISAAQISEPSQAELEIGQRAIGALLEIPLYARVDIVHDRDNSPRLMELELIDPELYVRYSGNAASLFADALERRLT